ncbi:hypothetical protein LBMAG56_37870 [Verrucomicrobiota bacterium]|nr:hypothetical protein LBMAG56_37870 [Verrucomicrobiota bacterium]
MDENFKESIGRVVRRDKTMGRGMEWPAKRYDQAARDSRIGTPPDHGHSREIHADSRENWPFGRRAAWARRHGWNTD